MKKKMVTEESFKSVCRTNDMLTAWVLLYTYNGRISDWLIMRGINRVVIYRMGDLGQLLYRQLMSSSINVLYGVDRRAHSLPIEGIRIVRPEEMSEGAEIVIVTAINSYESVKEQLRNIINVPVVSLESIIFDLVCGI